MEITILSAQGLKKPTIFSSLFSQHLKPYITLTTTPSSAGHRSHMYTTTVDHEGGVNPTWGDKFDLSDAINYDASFFNHNNKYSCIYLEMYTNRAILGPRFLGWCGIPASDIVDGFSPVGTARRMSYRLRKKDGSRGHGVVNVMVKLDGSIFQRQQQQQRRPVDFDHVQRLPEMSFGQVATGIPVKVLPAVGNLLGSSNSVNHVMRQIS
uniref:BON1-associated protein 2-like n=1 Tax=Erigeron canadensis TaxID=72917 RepID=UPI001CB9B620|nr:BON1-associated protein 2-like [Erigeron canadensis]